jgi:RHS repeat-associated protein
MTPTRVRLLKRGGLAALLLCCWFVLCRPSALGQTVSNYNSSPFDAGTPAESKGGLSSISTYAPDKVETVNLANGNLNVHIPLVTVGGRGSASYTLALSYNSKLWSPAHNTEKFKDPNGNVHTYEHIGATFDRGMMTRPNLFVFNAGWSIQKGPAIKIKQVNIDPINIQNPQQFGYKYVLTKAWLELPDGSEVELRDDVSDGAPALCPIDGTGFHQPIDMNRGRIWHSTDGTAITYVTDADNGVVTGNATGTVFLSDGTQLRMIQPSGGGATVCTQITDHNGNILTIAYDVPSINSVTYTDSLGRLVLLEPIWDNNNPPTIIGATITIKGYNGTADRKFTINTGAIGDNLRSDFASLQKPIITGDYDVHTGTNVLVQQGIPHTTLYGPYTGINAEIQFITYVDRHTTVSNLVLLDGRSFAFQYNQFGELAQITYPAGGISQIDYANGGFTFCESGYGNRIATERRTYSDGVTQDSDWQYTMGTAMVNNVTYPTVSVKVMQGTSTGALLSSQLHYFLALSYEYRTCASPGHSDGTGYDHFEDAREFRVDRQTSNGTQIEQKTWQQSNVTWPSGNAFLAEFGQQNPPNNPTIAREDTTLDDGLTKRTAYQYDQFSNATQVSEYDLGSGGNPGPLLRTTTRVYAGNVGAPPINPNNPQYCYTNLNGTDSSCGAALASDTSSIIHMRRLLLSETITGPGGQEAATTYEYDNYKSDSSGNHAPLVTNSNMAGYDGNRFTAFNAFYQPRGNVTSVSRWITGTGASASYAVSYAQYDNAGHVLLAKNPNANTTTYSYADNFGDGSNPDTGTFNPSQPTFASPTLVTNAVGHQIKTQYDYTRGEPTGVKDPNLVVSQTSYDVYDRPSTETAALGKPEQAQSLFTYPSPGSNTSTVSKQLDSTRWLSSQRTYDGFGRPTVVASNEDGHPASSATFTISSRTTYDGLGRVSSKSNPQRAASATTDGSLQTTYDLLGRPTVVTTIDGSGAATGTVVTTYSGNVTTVRDQALKQRRSTSDGLGRVTTVLEMEPYPSATVYATTAYSYDGRGNLRTITQGTQPQRVFHYDGLSRLSDTTTPESGFAQYQYDNDGNLKLKVDARGVNTSYVYDPLNRIKDRTYSNLPAGVAATPEVQYQYDTSPNGKGRLALVTALSTPASSTSYDSYDGLGRAIQTTQTTNATPYQVNYSYNLLGEMMEETYPSLKKVDTSYDGAGRIATIRQAGGGTYASGFSYTAHGAVQSMTLGNGLIDQTTFNSRLQPTIIQLGSGANPSSMLELDYTYNTSGNTDNNGNVLEQVIKIGTTVIGDQKYQYDRANRLSNSAETFNGGTLSWSRTFNYDTYGNMWVTNASGIGISNVTPQDVSSYDQMTNRFRNAGYDPSGNQTSDPVANGNQYVYDAENRMTSCTVAGMASSYTYDGDGRRVTKSVGGGAGTIYVYDVGNRMIAEYGGSATNAGISYLTTDHLGSTRLVTNNSQAVVARHDYLPFGEEIQVSSTGGPGGRTTSQGYAAADDTRQRFTSKEHDGESGLDYFLARYYSSAEARFTAVDPIVLDRNRIFDPQVLNGYPYTRGNPLRYVDPAGEKINTTGSEDDRKRYANDLSRRTGLQLTVDKKGAVKIEGKDPGGKNLTGAAKVVYDAIKSDKTVNIDLVEYNGSVDFGTPYSLDQKGNVTTSVQRIDFGDLDVANQANIADFNEETVVLHETIEAIGIQAKGLNPDDAHNLANQFSPGLQPAGQPTVTDLSAIGLIVANLPFQVQRPGGTSLTVTTLITLPPSGTKIPAANDMKGQLVLRQSNPVSVTAVRKN